MTASGTAASGIQVLCCQVATTTCGVDMALVAGIESAAWLRLNETGAGPVGWLNSHQPELPVYRMTEQLGLDSSLSSAANAKEGSVVVVDSPAGQFGLLVDRIGSVLDVRSDQFMQLPSVTLNSQKPILHGLVRQNDQFIIVADALRLRPESVEKSSLPFTLKSPGLPSVMSGVRRGSAGRSQIMTFSIAPLTIEGKPVWFGLSMTLVAEIVESPVLMPVPAKPSYVAGLYSWHHTPVPVVDLNVRLHQEPVNAVAAQGTRMLVARGVTRSELVGLLIHSDTNVLNLPIQHQPCQQALPFDQKLVQGAFELEDSILVIPNLDELLGC